MRTTIEVRDDHRAKLLEIAARRGEVDLSVLFAEAIELYLARYEARGAERGAALSLKGVLAGDEAEALRAEAHTIRDYWQ